MEEWIKIVSIIAGIITTIWTVYKYFDTKNREQNLKEFENYHKLIKELVQPESSHDGPALFIDRQTSILFELRHFKRYYPISLRTVQGLYDKWLKTASDYPRLLEETKLTIEFLKSKASS